MLQSPLIPIIVLRCLNSLPVTWFGSAGYQVSGTVYRPTSGRVTRCLLSDAIWKLTILPPRMRNVATPAPLYLQSSQRSTNPIIIIIIIISTTGRTGWSDEFSDHSESSNRCRSITPGHTRQAPTQCQSVKPLPRCMQFYTSYSALWKLTINDNKTETIKM